MSNGIVKEVQNLYLEELGITSPTEIDIEAIAYYKGATVKKEHLKGCEARIIGIGDRAIITVNEESKWPRQRFSIGHELGHWFKDRGKIGNLCSHSDMDSYTKGKPRKEKVANTFASELMIPTYLAKKSLQGSPLNLDTISIIKNTYDSSFMVALRKTISLNHHMGFFACYDSSGRRKYFSKNDDLHYYFSPPPEAPLGSCVSNLILKKTTDQSAKIIDGSVWCRTEDANDVIVHEHAFHYHGGDFITIVWWEEEEPIWRLNEL